MEDTKTVRSDAELCDPVYKKQLEDVASMRSSLLLSNVNNPASVKSAVQNITVMRVYHQLSRIVRFLEMESKIENKLYESIDCSLETMNSEDPSTWMALLAIQEKLLKCMAESEKLLQPYLDLTPYINATTIPDPDPSQSFANMIMDKDSRENLRVAASAILDALGKENNGGD